MQKNMRTPPCKKGCLAVADTLIFAHRVALGLGLVLCVPQHRCYIETATCAAAHKAALWLPTTRMQPAAYVCVWVRMHISVSVRTNSSVRVSVTVSGSVSVNASMIK